MQNFINKIRRLILLTLIVISSFMLVHIAIVVLGTLLGFWNVDKTPFYASLSILVYYVVPMSALLLIYLMISELLYIESHLAEKVANFMSEKALERAEIEVAMQAIKNDESRTIREINTTYTQALLDADVNKVLSIKEAKEVKTQTIRDAYATKRAKLHLIKTTKQPRQLKKALIREAKYNLMCSIKNAKVTEKESIQNAKILKVQSIKEAKRTKLQSIKEAKLNTIQSSKTVKTTIKTQRAVERAGESPQPSNEMVSFMMDSFKEKGTKVITFIKNKIKPAPPQP